MLVHNISKWEFYIWVTIVMYKLPYITNDTCQIWCLAQLGDDIKSWKLDPGVIWDLDEFAGVVLLGDNVWFLSQLIFILLPQQLSAGNVKYALDYMLPSVRFPKLGLCFPYIRQFNESVPSLASSHHMSCLWVSPSLSPGLISPPTWSHLASSCLASPHISHLPSHLISSHLTLSHPPSHLWHLISSCLTSHLISVAAVPSSQAQSQVWELYKTIVTNLAHALGTFGE